MSPTITIRALGQGDLKPVQALLRRACQYEEAHLVAREKLFGPASGGLVAEPVGYFEAEQLVGVAATSGPWIRILAIDPPARKAGRGSELLLYCEEEIRKRSAFCRVLDQPGNYLSPGIDRRDRETLRWMEKRNYQASAGPCNLKIALRDNPRVGRAPLKVAREVCDGQGYEIIPLPIDKIRQCKEFVRKNFSDHWAFEVELAARSKGVHIAISKGTRELVGFAAHDGNNAGLGWFGPMGTLAKDRGKGVGCALLLACLLDIQHTDASHSQIAWIGPRDFYRKIVGIAGERHFSTLRKNLR